jgi:DNA helicase-2/ATP-dependent DNA helicase PcrA
MATQSWTPAELMLLTFTRRAAEEMRSRAEAVADCDLHELRCGTFHAVGGQLLREHEAVSYEVIDEADSELLLAELIGELIDEQGVDDIRLPTPAEARDLLSRQREEDLPLVDLIAITAPRLVDAHRFLDLLGQRYSQRKEHERWRDYTDLLLATMTLLEGPQGPVIARELKAVLVDEVQDLNRPQRCILAALCSHGAWRICVGDLGQSIYGFRGASVAAVETAAAESQARVVRLTHNYRSVPEIVAYANSVSPVSDYAVIMTATRTSAGRAPCHRSPDNPKAEARLLGEWVNEQTTAGASLEQLAVLARGHEQLATAARVLAGAGIEFALLGRARGLVEEGRQGLVALMRLAADSSSRSGWLSLLRLCRVPTAERQELLGQLTDGDPASVLADLGAEHLTSLLSSIADRDPSSSLWRGLCLGEYGQMITAMAPDPVTRAGLVQQLLDTAPDAVDGDAFLAALTDAENMKAAGLGVRLATVHAAKGLEWPHVLLLGVREGRGGPAFAGFSRDAEAEAEERRLFYVAVTRAQETLTLLSASPRR